MSEKLKRPDWDEYFLEVMKAISKRGSCDRGQCGSVIVKDKQILATGYVGSVAGSKHCDEIGHQMKKVTHEDGSETNHCVRTLHAEQNAICQAAKRGISIEGATIYVTFAPCNVCAKLIAQCGIKRVVTLMKYHAEGDSQAIFKEAGIELEYITTEMMTYDNM